MAVQDELKALIGPAIESMGFEFVGVEYHSNPKNRLVRIFIDKAPDGVSIDDCAEVSREVSAVLDVEDPVSGQYSLEVSSPGVERPLFELEHYAAFEGQDAVVHLHAPHEGRRKFTGVLRGVGESDIAIEVDGTLVRLPFDAIRRGHIKPDWDALMAGGQGAEDAVR
jgi:ribosome maturation factor RimP